MPSFYYRAYDARGTLAQGRLEAASPDAARDALWTQGLTPWELRDGGLGDLKWWQRELFGGKSARRAEIAAFTRGFATLVRAEMPIDDALRILIDQASSPALKALIKTLREDILAGMALSEALEKHGALFSADYVSVIRAGEKAGRLGGV